MVWVYYNWFGFTIFGLGLLYIVWVYYIWFEFMVWVYYI